MFLELIAISIVAQCAYDPSSEELHNIGRCKPRLCKWCPKGEWKKQKEFRNFYRAILSNWEGASLSKMKDDLNDIVSHFEIVFPGDQQNGLRRNRFIKELSDRMKDCHSHVPEGNKEELCHHWSNRMKEISLENLVVDAEDAGKEFEEIEAKADSSETTQQLQGSLPSRGWDFDSSFGLVTNFQYPYSGVPYLINGCLPEPEKWYPFEECEGGRIVYKHRESGIKVCWMPDRREFANMIPCSEIEERKRTLGIAAEP